MSVASTAIVPASDARSLPVTSSVAVAVSRVCCAGSPSQGARSRFRTDAVPSAPYAGAVASATTSAVSSPASLVVSSRTRSVSSGPRAESRMVGVSTVGPTCGTNRATSVIASGSAENDASTTGVAS